MRGGAGSTRVAPAHMRSAARISSGAANISTGAQAPRHATVIRILPTRRVASSFLPTASSVSFGSENGVPGLGFDYPHLAAISGSLQSNQSFGRGGHRGQGSFVPILFGGYPYYYDSQDYDQPQQQAQAQPQVIVIQQPAPIVAAPQGIDAGSDAASPSSLATAATTAVRDVGEFVLVRRDGRVLFASAFSVVGAQLRYISPEGIRRTLPMAELDADATQQMNEARGTTVQISN